MSYKEHIKSFLGAMPRIFGISYCIRELVLRNKNTILCYHNPSPDHLRAHLTYLVQRYNIISLDALVKAIMNKKWSDIPPKSLVITFDDGLRGNYDLLKVIREFKVPVTIYLCSHIVNTNRRYWFLSDFSDFQKLKARPNQERLSVLKERVGFEQEKEYEEPQSLNIDEMKEMIECFNFQSHSRFHPVLTTCDDGECLEEIKGSKQLLENIFNLEIRHFAYPNGNYGKREIACLMQSGYNSAVSMDFGWNHVNSDPFCLKRIGVSDHASTSELVGEISGIFGFLRSLLAFSLPKTLWKSV